MICLRGIVLFALLLHSAARRSVRIGDSHNGARQHTNARITVVEASTQAWVVARPRGFFAAPPTVSGASAGDAFVGRSSHASALRVADWHGTPWLPLHGRALSVTGGRWDAVPPVKARPRRARVAQHVAGRSKEALATRARRARMDAEATLNPQLRSVNLARLAVPLRIGFAIGSGPWVNNFQRVQLSEHGFDIDWDRFAEDFKVVDEAGVEICWRCSTALRSFLTDAPLNEGSGIEADEVYGKGDDGEPMLTANWNFELREGDVRDATLIKELKKVFNFPLKVAGSTTFNMNEDCKIGQMKVGSWSINDQIVPALASLVNLLELDSSDEGMTEQRTEDLLSWELRYRV